MVLDGQQVHNNNSNYCTIFNGGGTVSDYGMTNFRFGTLNFLQKEQWFYVCSWKYGGQLQLLTR